MTVPSVSAAEYTFGSLGGEPIISAQSAIKAFAEKAGQGWSMSRFAGKANLFRTSLGFDYGSGCVLMARNRLNLLSTSEPLTLVLGSGNSGESVDLEGIYIRRAERIAPGASQSDDALYLVELVDSRYALNRKRVNKRYNCRVPRSTADGYITETLNSGVPWTWEEIIRDLWGSCDASIIGAYEKRPADFDLSDLASTPENLRYEGVSAWSALNDVVARVGCAVVHDNISVVNFYLIRLGKLGNSGVGGVECDPPMWNQGGSDSLCGASYSAGPTDRGQYTVDTSGDCPVFTPDLDGGGDPITGGDSLVADDEILWGNITLPEYVVVWFPTEYGASQITDELRGLGKWYPVAVKVSDGTILPNNSIAADWYENPSGTAGRDDGRMIRPDFNPNSEIFRYETMTARFLSVAETEPANNSDCLVRAKEIARDLYRCLFDFAPMHTTYAGVKFWAGDGNQYIPGKSISEVVWSDLGGGIRTDIYRRLPRLMPESVPIIQQPGAGEPCLFVALSDWDRVSSDGSEYCTGSRDGYVGRAARLELQADWRENNFFNTKNYKRIDGEAFCVWAPAETACVGNLFRIKCGQTFWAKWNNGRWEAISSGRRLEDGSLETCECTRFGFAIWKIGYSSGTPIWELDENRCSGCYTATEGRPTIPTDYKFSPTELNSDWLSEPDADPADFDPLTSDYSSDFRYVTCCNVPDVYDPPCDLTCCYTVSGLPTLRCDGTSSATRSRHMGHTAPCAWSSDDPGNQIFNDVGEGSGNCDNTWTFIAGEGVTMSTSTVVVRWVITWRTSEGGPLHDQPEAYGRIITAVYSLSAMPDCVSSLTASLTNVFTSGDSLPGDCKTCNLTDGYFEGLIPSTLSVTTTSCSTTSTSSSSTSSSTTPSTTSTSSTTTLSSTSSTTNSTTSSSTTGSTGSTTNSTTGSSTTGSSTSSTTAACTGNCNYIGHGTGAGSPTGFYWSFSGSGCSESCGPCFSGDVAALAEFIGRWPATYDDFVSVACT